MCALCFRIRHKRLMCMCEPQINAWILLKRNANKTLFAKCEQCASRRVASYFVFGQKLWSKFNHAHEHSQKNKYFSIEEPRFDIRMNRIKMCNSIVSDSMTALYRCCSMNAFYSLNFTACSELIALNGHWAIRKTSICDWISLQTNEGNAVNLVASCVFTRAHTMCYLPFPHFLRFIQRWCNIYVWRIFLSTICSALSSQTQRQAAKTKNVRIIQLVNGNICKM